jgi:hypothetical protein
MTISLASLEKLRAARLSTEQMDAVLDVLTVELAPLEHGRLANAERQKRYKERRYTNVVQADVTITSQASRVEDNPLLSSSSETVRKEERKTPPSPSKPLPDEGFGKLWAVYPKRNGSADKKGALKAYWPALKRASLETILEGARHFAQAMAERNTVGTEFIPHLRTWLNGDRWEERFEAPAHDASKPGNPAQPTLAQLEEKWGLKLVSK